MSTAWRDILQKELRTVLREKGATEFFRYTKSLLNVDVNSSSAASSKGLLVGELAECVLSIMVDEYIRQTGWQATGYHSLVLKNLGKLDSEFRTELDYTIVSPGVMLTIECKSYKGSVNVVDRCTFVCGDKRADVYKQSELHHKHLCKYAEQLTLPNKGVVQVPVFACAFLFSDSKLCEQRIKESQHSLTVLTAGTLYRYLDAIRAAYKKPVFDYQRACKIFGMLEQSELLHKQHANYVGYKRK